MQVLSSFSLAWGPQDGQELARFRLQHTKQSVVYTTQVSGSSSCVRCSQRRHRPAVLRSQLLLPLPPPHRPPHNTATRSQWRPASAGSRATCSRRRGSCSARCRASTASSRSGTRGWVSPTFAPERFPLEYTSCLRRAGRGLGSGCPLSPAACSRSLV